VPFLVAPTAAALFPVVYLYTHNIESIAFAHTIRAIVVVLTAAVLVNFLLVRLLRSPAKASIIQTTFTVVFFLFGYFVRYEQPISDWRWSVEWPLAGIYGFYAFAAVLVAIVVVQAKREPETAASVLGVVAVSILLMPILAGARYEAFVREPVRTPAVARAVLPAGSPHPDVYYIILDGYSRQDVLAAIYGVDNAPFLSALEARGFRVSRNSRSNYLETALSLGSSLNLTYLDEVAREQGDSKNRWQMARMIQDSEVMRVFRDRGYRFVNLPSGCYLTSPNPNADVEPTKHGVSYAEYESTLLRMTPLARVPWLDAAFAIWATHERDRVLFEFEALAGVPKEPGPKFVFAHILSPHPPFGFDEHGGAPQLMLPVSGNAGCQLVGPRAYR
jgi:hypothetical protein